MSVATWGPEPVATGGTRFSLWAPGAPSVALVLGDGRTLAMQPQPEGWHALAVADAGPGTRYQFQLPDGQRVPDPASRRNPDGVHGASEVVDASRYVWQDADWRGRPWHEAVLYELHVGTFTPEGTFAAAQARLAELAELGITAIEIMPLADAPGDRGWGYDGVLLFAPMRAYGTPDELRALIDHAHALGLMVFIDVVYNHFGPDGNYLHGYCPEFFDAQHTTPWGSAIGFGGPHSAAVRAFYIGNAVYWIEQFHADGLRIDAVHQIRDGKQGSLVEAIASAIGAGPGARRAVHLVLENDLNEAHRLRVGPHDSMRGAIAQWNDDLHHAAHVVLTGETDGYYREYAEAPVQLVATALAEGFVFQGQHSPPHGGPRGEPSGHLPPTAFVAFLQNHDHIGNRAFGERLSAHVRPERLQALYACLLLSPQVPMLFMGEEFAASSPFLYFCAFDGALGQSVTEGRRREFGRFGAFADEAARARIPDPNAAPSFVQSKLDWRERASGAHAAHRAWLRELLTLRRTQLVPRLAGPMQGGQSLGSGDQLCVRWQLADGTTWELAANLSDAVRPLSRPAQARTVYRSHPQPAPWSVQVSCWR